MNLDSSEPFFVPGGISVDDRGALRYVNDFPVQQFKRFYIVENFATNFVRAWHGHRVEAKAVLCLSGAALIATVKVDNWEAPSKNLQPSRFVLSLDKPGILFIPGGYANGFMSLTQNLKLMFFSSSNLEESHKDDFRFESRYWDCWNVVER